jgi:hypothetical protein
MKKGWIVVTTINAPSTAIEFIAKLCGSNGWSAVVVGDTKTPRDWACEHITYLSVERQKEIFGAYADILPYRHYCRKNIGYLYALSQGADYILETDDDNIPYPSFGKEVERSVTGRLIEKTGWVNIYKYFTDAPIWPRGLPLDEIHSLGVTGKTAEQCECPVQQFLADEDPDVDAIYRLIFKNSVSFNPSASPVVLAENAWVPFNSQNTLFFREAFPLLYLPCHVSFRMTDIWRSFVVQETLWVHGYKLAFHTSTVKQLRNEHDLMQDFRQEIIGYTDNRRIAELLDSARAGLTDGDRSTMSRTAMALWRALAKADIIPAQELPAINGWFDWVDTYTGRK